MRLFLLDRQGQEINAARGRTAYIEERHSRSHKHAGADRSHQAAACIHWNKGKYYIKKK